MQRLTARLLSLLPWVRRTGVDTEVESPETSKAAVPLPLAFEPVAGSAEGWLRVLTAEQLLHNVQAPKALKEIWRQSRMSTLVWERDFLPAIHRYAEFVQLVPASEAHHHAHVGGLLSHTIEMVLAAMTWRNGYLLPSGEPIEVIDAQRDEWSYVVFFAALLHDIAKPMTDLRIFWRTRGMVDPLRWVPMAGPLPQITQGRVAPEYKVEFTPKSQRDYSAHSRLAMLLLPRIAPPSVLSFLSMQPKAFEALNQYLSGLDRDSLVAKLVSRADRASAQRALLMGSKARFSTATALPLIDLLMQALGAMLRAGTTLPLNRSGAAGWVFDGSVWFVAKRVADAVRDWIKKNEPDETVPGEAKNDRLFDTWQEYGAIELNPQTNQAVWYVTVHGVGSDKPEDAAGTHDGTSPGAYEHSLTMLRFPLAKLYEDASQYPPPMRGRIEVHLKRKIDADNHLDEAAASESHKAEAAGEGRNKQNPAAESSANRPESAADGSSLHSPSHASAATGKTKPRSSAPSKPTLKEPSFNKPASKPKPDTLPAGHAPAGRHPQTNPAEATVQSAPAPRSDNVAELDHDAAFLLDEQNAAAWLDGDDDARTELPPRSRKSRGISAGQSALTPPSCAPAATVPHDPPISVTQPVVQPYLSTSSPPRSAMNEQPVVRNQVEDREPEIVARNPARVPGTRSASSPLPAPVVLQAKVPDLPQREGAPIPAAPSEQALAFIAWLQQSLADRTLKYNETGAAVHFTAEGMALVSPLIFKLYARTLMDEATADDHALTVQREVIKAGWHMMGPNRKNIVRYEVVGRGGTSVSKLSAVVLLDSDKWVLPVPPTNPALRLA